MGDITLRQALDEYKEVFMASRNFAERTRVEYFNDLEDLIQFLEQLGIKEVKNIELPQLVRYLAELDHRGLAGTTRKRKVVSIRSFLSYLYQNQYMRTNLTQRLIPPFAEAKNPRYLTKSEYERLLEAAAHNPRDFALIQLILQTGIKLSELTRLTVNDVELPSDFNLNKQLIGYLHIRGGERRKPRMVLMNYSTCLALNTYSKIRLSTENQELFVNKFGRQLGFRGVEKILKKYLRQVGIYDASVQSLRHTYGIHEIAKGTDPKTLRKAMGLKDQRSTLVYSSISTTLINKEL